MSQRGMDFLRNWIRKNIEGGTYEPLYDTRAKVFAEQCAADARNAEISVEEIEVETGDLADCMFNAMNRVSGRTELRAEPVEG
jgi:hypothetical protein